MWRLLAGVFVGVVTIVSLNACLLFFAPHDGMPLQGPIFFWDKVLTALALVLWAAAVLGAGVLACRVAGRLEGVVCLGSVVLATVVLVGFPFTILKDTLAAHLQLGSIILAVPLLFIFYAGAMISFFARRPDMI